MNSPIFQLLVLAGIAIFLILKLRSVLGTREGFEQPPLTRQGDEDLRRSRQFDVIEGGPDHDIVAHADEGSDDYNALLEMKKAEPGFNVTEFLTGARGAYEMILMGFERGDLAEIKPFLDEDVYASFASVVEAREEQGLTIEADFIGIREMALHAATFDTNTKQAEISVKFVGELTSVVRDNAGEIVEGEPGKVKRQKDIWTFARAMGSDDPNWQLVATDA